jgi:hypothetical protein
MHATTQPVATNNLPGAARAAVIAVIVIAAAIAGFLTGNALQGAGSSGSVGGFSAAELVYLDQGLRIARQEASAVSMQQQLFADLGLQIARQEASAVTTQQSPATWETDHSGPAVR